MPKYFVVAPDGKELAGVYETRAAAEHAVERLAAEYALGFSIEVDRSDDEAKQSAEVARERKAKQDRARQAAEQAEFAKARQ